MSTHLVTTALLTAASFFSTPARADSTVVFLEDDLGPVATVIIDGVNLEALDLSTDNLDLNTFGANIDACFLTIDAEREGLDVELGDRFIPAEIISAEAMQEELAMGDFTSQIAVNINQSHHPIDPLAINFNPGYLLVSTTEPLAVDGGSTIAVNINQSH